MVLPRKTETEKPGLRVAHSDHAYGLLSVPSVLNFLFLTKESTMGWQLETRAPTNY